MNLIKLADWINENWFSAHRGAVKVGPYYVLFGNDGFGCPMVTLELAAIFRWLRDHKHRILGFATDAEFFTWVLVIRPSRRVPETQFIDMMFDAWNEAVQVHKQPKDDHGSFYKALQTQIAIETMYEKPLPRSLVAALKKTKFRAQKVA